MKENSQNNEASSLFDDKEKEKKEEEENLNNCQNDENLPLINEEDKKEKEKVVDILNSLSENLTKDENKTINDVYEEYININDITKKKIKEKTNICLVYFMFYFLLPIFVIINLIGIFEILSIMRVFFEILKKAFISYSMAFFFKDHKKIRSLILILNITFIIYSLKNHMIKQLILIYFWLWIS